MKLHFASAVVRHMDRDGAEGVVVLVGRRNGTAIRVEAGWVWNFRVFELRDVPFDARSVVHDEEAEMVWQDAVKVAVTVFEREHPMSPLRVAV